MNINKYLKQVAHKDKWDSGLENEPLSDVWVSNFDNSYIAHVGMEKNIKFLADREITNELTHGVGFSPKDNKWYGWSHRAIYGFKIGSTCKKGDCHYKGSTIKEQEQSAIDFWSKPSHLNVINKGIVIENGERYFNIQWDYTTDEKLVPNKKLHGTIGGCKHHIKSLGHGEWIAKTMEDAKQMAIDFNEGVS